MIFNITDRAADSIRSVVGRHTRTYIYKNLNFFLTTRVRVIYFYFLSLIHSFVI